MSDFLTCFVIPVGIAIALGVVVLLWVTPEHHRHADFVLSAGEAMSCPVHAERVYTIRCEDR